MMSETPEQKARQQIDAQLVACGWLVQDYKKFNPSAGRGIALREAPLKSGTCDYLLLVDRKAIGVIEAKKEGTLLSGVAEQSGHYAENLPDFIQSITPGMLPFLYESTGVETFFRDERDPEPRSRRVFSFHRPETLAALVAEPDTLRCRLADLSVKHPLPAQNLRACQVEGITNLEESFSAAHPRALVQMATGAGKTYTACSFTYRLIKHAGAKRVLFLVDRANLGRQAMSEFQQFVAPDTGRKFTEVYNVQHLTSSNLDSVARVTICTIQRLYSILRGEELDEDIDEKSGYEIATADDRPKDVAYNPAVPLEAFDFIVVDECHRSIYGLWRQVLEYFDAFLVGLTATPSKQTIGFFNQNLVMEYNHERAVADGVNVGYEVYRIRTEVTEHGGKVEKGFYVDRRSKETRKVRWERLDEDLAYAAKDLDRSVVVKSQIRTVLQAYKDALFTELFPGRTLVPKTLIFCKDDSHAEDTVHLVREVFGKGNDFAKKITYKTYNPETKRYEKSETLIQEFRTSPQLRIAVTVDMIATGTDIKPLECLLFLRDTKSRTYFEQMKGRGTRVLTATDLQAVSGADALAKTHFVIVDAVGVCESDKTDSRPLERQRTVTFDKLLLGVALGKRDEDTLTTLAGRLARLDREISRDESKKLAELSGGKSLSQLSNSLLAAVNPDKVEAASRRLLLDRVAEPGSVEPYGSLQVGYFDPDAPVTHLTGDLPHWRQENVTYFVTFRLSDSIPQEKLNLWRDEMNAWLEAHPAPHDEKTRKEFYQRFPERMQVWLDAGSGSCILRIPEVAAIVTGALKHFDGQRYRLDEFTVAANHVHVLVTPTPGHELSDILHSWKSFTAHEILKVEAASRRLRSEPVTYLKQGKQRRDAVATVHTNVWQKESFDHIVRSPASLDKFRDYIRSHQSDSISTLNVSEDLRRDAAATLVHEACAPFDLPALRDALTKAKQEAEQTIDITTIDKVIVSGFDAAAKEKAENILKSFREYIEQHKAEITALQILFSRPFKQRLTEPMLKELEKKLRDNHAAWTEDNLWNAFAVTAPGKVKGKSQAGRFADLVALVRFALEQQPVLAPFADSVTERFNEWLMDKAKSGTAFTAEQLAWLRSIADHIATSLSIEPEDLELSPFNQRGGLGKAHQLFGDQLPKLLDELNEVLAA
jgi:type I restriction enzyme R subunit